MVPAHGFELPTDYKSVALPTELCRQRGENNSGFS